VTTVMLSRPQARNAVDPDTALALHRAFVDFEEDPDAAVAVLWGEGGAFCAGFDLKALAGGVADGWLRQLHFGAESEGNVGHENGVHARYPLGPMGPTRLELHKPVIAAIAGPAVAGGLELALWCDLRVMEASAYAGVFCRRWGVPLIDGGTVRLPRIVGHGRAMDLLLTGRRIEAAECLDWGLANRLCDDGSALEAARDLASDLARFPQACLRADRASAMRQWSLSPEAALASEWQSAEVFRREGAAGAAR